MRRLFARLEMPVRCAWWGGSPRMHQRGWRSTRAACPWCGARRGGWRGHRLTPGHCLAADSSTPGYRAGVEVGEDGVAPVTIVEVVHRHWQHQAEWRSGETREQGKDEESNFASSMGHSGKGIRLIGRRTWWGGETVGGVRPGAAAVPWAWWRSVGGDAVGHGRARIGDFLQWALGQTASGRFNRVGCTAPMG
jgi:hypothetical protein